jgi:hypothetical protein
LKFPKGKQWNDAALDANIQRLLGLEDYAQYKQLVSRLFLRLDDFSRKKLRLNSDFVVGSHPDLLCTVNTDVLQPSWMSASQPGKASALDKFLEKTSASRKHSRQ